MSASVTHTLRDVAEQHIELQFELKSGLFQKYQRFRDGHNVCEVVSSLERVFGFKLSVFVGLVRVVGNCQKACYGIGSFTCSTTK